MKKCLKDYSLIEIIEHLIKLNKLHHFYEVEKTLKGAPKKEIELKDGQIYQYNDGFSDEKYYLLVKHEGNTYFTTEWKLINIINNHYCWGGWLIENEMKLGIKNNFTPCTDATITVKEKSDPDPVDKMCFWETF